MAAASRANRSAIYFDITDIVRYASINTTVTGIQRSALNIIRSVVRADEARPIYGLVKHPVTGAFKVADLSFMRDRYDLTDFVARFEIPSGKDRWFIAKLGRYRNRPIRRFLRKCKLQVKWTISPKLRLKYEEFVEAKPSCLSDASDVRGGVIVDLGAGWATDYFAITQFSLLHSCRLVWFIHDIIPIVAPVYASGQKAFEPWLNYIASYSWLIACNSQFTKNQILDYFRTIGVNRTVHVASFPHEFASASENESAPIRDTVAQLANAKYVLCVGTVEIRKNLLKLLRTWNELRNSGGAMPKLVLCGKKGWKVGGVYEFLAETANIEGTVELVEAANDNELEYLYRHCEFTVFPSLFEGWGLPIGESLWFGKPVLCADNSSMPEVGGRFATYFNHDEPESLARKLQDMMDHPVQLPSNIRDDLTTWQDTANSILNIIDRQDEQDRSAATDVDPRALAFG